MEAELDTSLGYEKITRVMSGPPTIVMVTHQKHLRASMVNSKLTSQETMREFESKLCIGFFCQFFVLFYQ